MRFLHYCVLLLSLTALLVAGCGGGGGGGGGTPTNPPPTTKTATLKLATQSSLNPAALIGGFDLKVTLPAVASLPTDASGTPTSGTVLSSGQFAGSDFSIGSSYAASSHELTVIYGSANSYPLGEFITIVMTVPVSYVPNMNDVIITLFNGRAPTTGNLMPDISAIKTSFN